MFIEYIDKKIEGYKEEELLLQNVNRNDEANFAKIKINICEICKTLYNVSKKEPTEERARDFYAQKLEKLSLEWQLSRDKAKEHGDTEKVVVEDIKLEVLNEIKGQM